MMLSQVIKENSLKLKERNIINPQFEAEILLSHIIEKNREYILAHSEEKISKWQLWRFESLIKKRLRGTPLAYLVGYKYFYGLKFLVNKNVLVPRPETEMMVDEVFRIASKSLLKALRGLVFIDTGTGSGNIIISLAKKLSFGYPELSFGYYAIDIARKALRVAKKNAKLHGVDKNIKFFHGNLLEPILPKLLKVNCQKSIVILTNLPYLTPKQVESSPTIQAEPRLALVAGSDGLKYYRELFEQIKILKNKIDNSIEIFCEIDDSQNEKIIQLIKNELPQAKIKIKKDLAGRNRLAIIHI